MTRCIRSLPSRRAVPAPRSARGFTLIEVMIVVAVIGLLAAIALPSYTAYVQRARRVDAKNAVLDMAGRQERYFSINNVYATDTAALGYATTAVNSSGSSYYELSMTVGTPATTFVAKATPTGAQMRDATCYAFRIDHLGVQSNVDGGGAALAGTGCW